MAGVAVWNVVENLHAQDLVGGVFQADEAVLAALQSFSRAGVVAAHKQLRQESAAMEAVSKSQGTYRGCVPSYMDPHGLPSFPVPLVTSRSTLCKNVGLVDLEPGRANPGSVLHGFLRVEAFRCSNVAVTALEDDSGRMARVLALNSLFWNSSQEEVARIFPEGAEVLVKHPCLVEAEFCQGLALWVPNPLSLEIVSYFPRMEVGEPDVYLSWGSKELDERKNFLAAADLFTRCLECLRACGDETKMVVALVRRAEARIKLERYEEALADVEKALALDRHDFKSLAVKGAVLLGLKQYGSSTSCFKQVAEVEASPTYRSLYDASLRFNEQSERGVYDLSEHYLAAGANVEEDRAPELADFVGPVKVAMTRDGRGRGLFLTESVSVGQLLLVSNAVAMVFPDEDCPVLEVDKFGTLLTAVLRACMASPRTLAQVYSLAESDPVTGLTIDKNEVPEMELFQPNTGSLELHEELLLDVTRIANILHCINENGKAADTLVTRDFDGLWTLPSFLNHSCLPNVGVHYVGKALLVVAARDMEAETELVRSYGSALAPWNPMRRESIRVECRCERCALEKRLEEELRDVSQRFDALLNATSMVESEFHKQLGELAVELERKVWDMDLREAEKQWLRTSYCLAYLSFYLRNETCQREKTMPLKEDIARALHSTSPGFSKTLMAMCCLLEDGNGSGGLLEDECFALCGRQNHEVAAAIVKQARYKERFLLP
ncbi:hypothetical protein SELMODRAFT_412433 [Selaginella moellendorffii]|uniref:SET domain-containing protein n=1 Tax=Selaginella moellendorffii TaxID=88036 RepID=D8RLH2_SELML|nr:hypothetical protein SELMODRAFT_412433 [Selaginella moellendorffii]